MDRAIKALLSLLGGLVLLGSNHLGAGEIKLEFADGVPAELRVQATQAVERFIASRHALKQGAFKAIGTRTHSDRRNPEKTYSGPVEITSAFDFEKKLFRFDRSEFQRVTYIPNALPGESEDAREARATTKDQTIRSKFALNEDKCINWNDMSPREVRVAPLTDRSRARGGPADPFDVRIIGFQVVPDYFHLDKTLESVGRSFSQPIAAVETAESGRMKLEWRLQAGTRTIWLDARQGDCPVYLGLTLKEERNEAVVEASTDWQLVKGIWIPKDARWTRFQYEKTRPVQLEYKLKFEWERVNEAPNPDQFRVESFMTGDRMRIAEIK